jgi:hypothetical protein
MQVCGRLPCMRWARGQWHGRCKDAWQLGELAQRNLRRRLCKDNDNPISSGVLR